MIESLQFFENKMCNSHENTLYLTKILYFVMEKYFENLPNLK